MSLNVYDDWNEDGTLPELKPCPFCRSKGILCDNGYEQPVVDPSTGAYVDMDIKEGDAFWCECPECGAILPGADTPELAIDQWNRRDNPPNATLTPEELREMDGEPVWIEWVGHPQAGWALVRVWSKAINVIYLTYHNGNADLLGFVLNNGGKIYRRKPEEGTA